MTPARSRHTIVAHDPLHAVRLVFALNGLVLASWVPHIPAVATRLGLTPGALGRVLLGMAVGSFVGIPLAGATIGRVGSRVVVGIAAVCFCLAGVWPVRAPSSTILVLVLACFGAANGAMDISMNAQAAAVERHLGRPVMSSMHGMWSLGGLTGAAIAAAALWAGISPQAHMLVICTLALLGILLALVRFLPSTSDLQAAASGSSRAARPVGPVLTLGAMAFVALMVEGAMGDWSALYLRDGLGASASISALGFAAGSATMALGRFRGDALVQRFGSVVTVQRTAAAATLGLGVALIVGHPLAAILGFACLGAGLANLIPIIFRAAAALPGIDAGRGLAAVSGAGYVGFLVGPPLIGLISDYLTLARALWVTVASMAWIALAAQHVDPAAGAPTRGADVPGVS